MKKGALIFLVSSVVLFSYGCSKPKPKPTPDPDPPTPDPTGPFTVTWDLDNGSAPIQETYNKGETPSYKGEIVYKEGHNEDYGYLFKSWDKPLEEVTGDVTYKAVYSSIEYKVVTSAVVIYLQKKNADLIEFHYTGELKEVDWGDGTRNKSNTHTYNLPSGKEIYPTFFVKIYGNLTSISFADENGVLYGNTNKAIKCINLASTITDIPANAFNGLYVSNAFLLSKNVRYVGKDAFKGLASDCLIYTDPDISFEGWDEGWNPNGYRVVDNIKDIGIAEDKSNPNSYFAYVIQKQDPYDYLAISSYFTFDKNNINSITIPDKIEGMYVNSIIYSPFSLLLNLKEIKIEASQLYYIGEEALKNLSGMTALSLPKTLTIIGKRAFYNCYNLTTLNLNDNDSLISIEEGAFDHVGKIVDFKIPSTVSYIGPSAFNYCHAINITNLENTQITDIYEKTFYQCWDMTSIGLPITLKTIHTDAFNRCDKLATIDASRYESGNDVPTCENDAFKDAAKSGATVICNKSFEDDTTAKTAFTAKGWPSTFSYQIE